MTLPSAGPAMPHDVEAERALVAIAITTAGEAYDAASIAVRPDSFHTALLSRVWRTIGEIRARGETPTLFAIEHALAGTVPSADVLALDSLRYDPASLDRVTRIVAEHAQRRALINACAQAASVARSLDTDHATVIRDAERAIYAALKSHATHDAYKPMPDTVADVMRENAYAAAEMGRVVGVPTGIHAIDSVVRGFRRGELVVIGGRTSEGKSSLALTIARYNAQPVRGRRVVYFSCEMTREDLVRRLVANEGISLSDQESYAYVTNPRNAAELRDAYAEVSRYPIEVVYQPSITFAQVRTYMRRFVVERPADLVILDYLGIMGTDTKADRRDLDLASFVQDALLLGAEFACPVIAIQGLNRKSAHDGKLMRPQISHLMDASAIEYGAHHVLLVHNPNARLDGDDADDSGERDIIIAKNRRGPKNRTVKTHFHGRKFLFCDVEGGGDDDRYAF